MGEAYIENKAEAAIEAFLQIIAEQGWNILPNEPTLEMATAYGKEARAGPINTNKQCVFDRKAYQAMQVVAPEFKWKDD